jgi:predicted RNA polymerase sigma factor
VLRRSGPYQVQAAIAACHAEAAAWDQTDWADIVGLYDTLLSMMPSPVVRLNRALALRHTAGASAALGEVDAIASELESYYLLYATRAQLLRELGRDAEAQAALRRALTLTSNPAERTLIEGRLKT